MLNISGVSQECDTGLEVADSAQLLAALPSDIISGAGRAAALSSYPPAPVPVRTRMLSGVDHKSLLGKATRGLLTCILICK